MSYSTGSGTYIDMMTAILNHAVLDGWSTTGGGWPISKGMVRGVDWTTYTTVETDFTLGGAGGSITRRTLRLAVGSSGANATANLPAGYALSPNLHYAISEWHIFSDPSVSDHINVVYKFTNGVDPEVYGHFSFGEIDKMGMTYGSIAYATGNFKRGYAAGLGSGPSASDWNSLFYSSWGFSGGGYFGINEANTQYMIHSTDSPVPLSSGWSDPDTTYPRGDRLFRMMGGRHPSRSQVPFGGNQFTTVLTTLDSWPWSCTDQPFSGSVSMMPMPFILINGDTSESRNMWVGCFPNIRKATMDTLSPGDEIIYGSETWKVFPALKKTAANQLELGGVVSSGLAGYAYKKVA